MGQSLLEASDTSLRGFEEKGETCTVVCRTLFEILFTDDSAYYSMAQFPRWSKLKHFPAVTTIKFSDGQGYYDILKVCRLTIRR